jgi:CRP-like cAMP-binding protein
MVADPGGDLARIGAQRTLLAAAMRRVAPLDDASIAAVANLCEARDFVPGEWLLRGGERARDGFLVLDGLARELYVDAAGDEHTRAFTTPGGFTGSLLDLLGDAPSVTWIQALLPTRVLAFPYARFDALCSTSPALTQFARRLAERLYVRKAQREHELLALTAAERHARWLHAHAALDGVVTGRILASYLGITPEHLSRLRRARAQRDARPRA